MADRNNCEYSLDLSPLLNRNTVVKVNGIEQVKEVVKAAIDWKPLMVDDYWLSPESFLDEDQTICVSFRGTRDQLIPGSVEAYKLLIERGFQISILEFEDLKVHNSLLTESEFNLDFIMG